MTTAVAWIIFSAVILVMLALDLGVFHRKTHVVGMKEAIFWSVLWTVIAFVFNAGVYYVHGKEPAYAFLSAYILERMLSFDNLFVFLLVFNYFHVPDVYHHRILFWGILGALVMRAVFIASGIALLHYFHWIIYVFGAVLLITGLKLAFQKDQEIHPEKNLLLKLFKRLMPVTDSYESGTFLIKKGATLFATPLLVVLIVIESTDVVFAVDSIPAVLAISRDPFIVYTSNVFAILGLRALYFVLEGLMRLFHHLHYGLSIILVLIGLKMLAADFVHVSSAYVLALIMGVLVISIIASLIWPEKAERKEA